MSYNQRRLATLNAFINDPDTMNKPFQLLLELTQAVEEIERLNTQLADTEADKRIIKIASLQNDNERLQALLKRWVDISYDTSWDEQSNELKQLIEETKCQQ